MNWPAMRRFMSVFVPCLFCFLLGLGMATYQDREMIDEAFRRMAEAEHSHDGMVCWDPAPVGDFSDVQSGWSTRNGADWADTPECITRKGHKAQKTKANGTVIPCEERADDDPIWKTYAQ